MIACHDEKIRGPLSVSYGKDIKHSSVGRLDWSFRFVCFVHLLIPPRGYISGFRNLRRAEGETVFARLNCLPERIVIRG